MLITGLLGCCSIVVAAALVVVCCRVSCSCCFRVCLFSRDLLLIKPYCCAAVVLVVHDVLVTIC